jgi:flagellar biosynthesis/type III secretory pathway M-ring protein FliF/YscJ
METPSTSIGPGIGAFVAFFVLAVALWLLMRNMNSRMRRMAYKEQQRVAEMEAREAERDSRREKKSQEPADQPGQEADDSADPAP